MWHKKYKVMKEELNELKFRFEEYKNTFLQEFQDKF